MYCIVTFLLSFFVSGLPTRGSHPSPLTGELSSGDVRTTRLTKINLDTGMGAGYMGVGRTVVREVEEESRSTW